MKRQTEERLVSLSGAHRGVAQLQFQVGDDRCQVGIAAALAIAVHAALHVGGAGLHGGQGVGHGHVGIVVGVDADHAVEALADFGDESRPGAR